MICADHLSASTSNLFCQVLLEMDEDKSRTLEREELEHLAERHNLEISEMDVDAGMAELDPEATGHVDFQHFWRWCIYSECSVALSLCITAQSLHQNH
jgi:Ca2+-binding EF-hand superfamily protein